MAIILGSGKCGVVNEYFSETKCSVFMLEILFIIDLI